MTTFLWEGILLGLAIAIPIGPMTILCINKTIAQGKMHGLAAGLGITMADSCYAAMAAFGLTAISTILLQYQFWFNIIGGLFLLYVGVQAFLKESIDIRSNTTTHTKGLWASFLSTAAITISSPATVLLFVSVFSIMGIDAKAEDKSLSAASLIVLGFFLGSMVWWVFVSYITSFFRSKLNKTAFSWVNKISGIIMCSFAVFAFLKAFEII